jgi:hypothetical protein
MTSLNHYAYGAVGDTVSDRLSSILIPAGTVRMSDRIVRKMMRLPPLPK